MEKLYNSWNFHFDNDLGILSDHLYWTVGSNDNGKFEWFFDFFFFR